MAFKYLVFLAAVACANAGFLNAPAVATTYAAAPALSYAPAAPVLGSTFHGNYAAAAPAIAYGAPAAFATPAITSQSSNILRSFGNLGQVSTYSKTIDTPFSSVRKADIRVSNPGLRIAAAAPALAYSAAPAVSTYHGAIAAPALSYAAAPAIGAYHGAIAAPALSYSAGPLFRSAVAAPALGYGLGYRSAAIAAPAALGVAYSAAPAVSHINYASAYANYGW